MIEYERTTLNFNGHRPVMYVLHRQMKRRDGSPLRSHCAKCEEGILLVRRDKDELLPDDRCVICGQRYHYLDVDSISKPIKELPRR